MAGFSTLSIGVSSVNFPCSINKRIAAAVNVFVILADRKTSVGTNFLFPSPNLPAAPDQRKFPARMVNNEPGSSGKSLSSSSINC